MKGTYIMKKITKILSAIVACSAAISMAAVSASAFKLDKDLKTGWSVSITVPGEEFEEADEDSVFTLTYEADKSLAEKDGHNYWCVKTMLNDTGWPFIDTLVGLELSEGKDSYPLDPEKTEIKFTIPAEDLENLKVAGMAFMGHGIKLGELTFSNDEKLSADAGSTDTAAAPAEETKTETTAAVDSASTASTTDAKGGSNPKTGVEDIAGLSLMILSAGVAVASSKKRK